MNLQFVLRNAAFAGVFLLSIGASRHASAATLTVNSTADTVAVDGQVTLREALNSANSDTDVNEDVTASRDGDYATNGEDFINIVPPGFGMQTIVLGGSELSVQGKVTIFGITSSLLTISGNDASRIFSIGRGAQATIGGITLSRAKQDGPNLAEGAGGAVVLEGGAHLTLQNSVISNNRSNYGVIYSPYQSTISLLNCTFTGNSAAANAGLLNFGTATVTRCTFSGNASSGSNGITNGNTGVATVLDSTFANNTGSSAGALSNDNFMSVTNCTLSGNRVEGEGGAVVNGGTLNMLNSTIAGNSAQSGGAIYIGRGKVTLAHCTLSGNSARGGAGGIFNLGNLVANNTIFNDINRNIFNTTNFDNTLQGTLTDGGYNISNDTSGPNNGTTDKIASDIKLDTLKNNGGPTQTLALLPGSPAIDAGNSRLTVDQRGAVRDSKRDIGAFESNSAPTLVISPQSGEDRVGTKRTFTLVGSDLNGARDIKNMWLLINTLPNWSGGATLVFEPNPTLPTSGLLYLRRGGSFLGPMKIGPGTNNNAVLDNGAVRVVAGGVKVSAVGTRMTLTLPLTIRDGLVGQNTLYALITDASGAHDPAQVIDGYRRFGTYTVIPQFRTSVNRVPIVSRLNPLVATTSINAQGLTTQTFGFAIKDEDGTGDVESVDFAVGKTLETSTKFVYFPRTRAFYIRVGDSLIGAGNGMPTRYNPVDINGSNTKVVIYPDGKSFGLTIPIVGTTKLLGQNKIWIRAKDLQGATAPNGDEQGFVLSGTWNVMKPAPSPSGSALSAGNS